MGAMPEEIDALLPQIREQRAFDRAGRRFIHGSIHGVAIVVVFSRWGKVAAASTATELIVAHGVDRLVFSGVAGSLREDVMVGDVVVATSLSQHDLDASPFFPPRVIPLLGVDTVPTDMELSSGLARAAEEFMKEDADREWRMLTKKPLRAGRVHRGDITSGDQVISSAEARIAVAARAPTALCVEMEGAAAGQVCFEHGVPFACVRTISDSADEGVEQSIGPFLGGLAAAYTGGIVGRWLRKL